MSVRLIAWVAAVYAALGAGFVRPATGDRIPGAPAFTVNDVIINGDRDKRLNVVFLSEGYTVEEMSKFDSDVLAAVNDLFAEPPYQQYASYFNVYSIGVPSAESGMDHPNTAADCPVGLPTQFRDTYFDATFDNGNIHRALVIQNYGAAFGVLADFFPDWDIAFIVVNTDWYGGTGGTFAVFSTHASAGLIAIHELGHSFAELADEYDYGGRPGWEAPNTTAETERELIRWNTWIEATTPVPTPETSLYADVIGLFEGAAYNPVGWYRPKLNCMMKSLSYGFCEVCLEQTIKSVYSYLAPVDSRQPDVDQITMHLSITRRFSVEPKSSSPNTVETSWYVDGAPVAAGANSYYFDASLFGLGTHDLTAVTSDTTAMVRNDPDTLLQATTLWHVVVDTVVTAAGNELAGRQEVSLYPNTPNPFNPSTTLGYYLPDDMPVDLSIYGVGGRRVKTLVSAHQAAGDYRVVWNGTDDRGRAVGSGVYFCRLRAGGKSMVRKVVVLK